MRKSDGEPAHPGDDIACYWRGTLEDGFIFDTTYRDGLLSHLTFDRVIDGMQEGFQLIGEGGMIELVVPPHLAYGEKGAGPIPPNETVTFLIEIEQIERPLPPQDFRLRANKMLEPDENMPEEFSTTPSGVKYRLRVDTGRVKPDNLDDLSIFYSIRLNDAEGEFFNDTYHTGYGRNGPMNALPVGIREGIMQCPVSGSVEFIVPPELLGDRSLQWMAIPRENKDVLPENTPIHFIVEISTIQRKAMPEER
ncbi:MAG: FKBP-type peptidyl-prolyl cis-trans isomerase [Planctomycetaceae bacterium]